MDINQNDETQRALNSDPPAQSNTWMIVAIIFIILAVILLIIIIVVVYAGRSKPVPMVVSAAEVKAVDNAIATVNAFQKKVATLANKGCSPGSCQPLGLRKS